MEHFRRGELVFDVLDAGPVDGPIVVLLHGFPQFAATWTPVIEQLTAQGFRCLAPDQRGYSAGARPRGRRAYRLPELVEDVRALIDASGAETVHLVGQDWGGAVAWAFAGTYPDRLASLSVLSVPHSGAFVRAMATSRQGLTSWYMYLFQLPAVPEWVLTGRRGKGLRTFLVKGHQSPVAAERDTRAMTDSGALSTALNWYRAMPLTSPGSVSGKVAVPTLFAWGDRDIAVLRKTAEKSADWVTGPYRFEVLPGVSHWIPDEAPAETARLLLEQFAAYPLTAR